MGKQKFLFLVLFLFFSFGVLYGNEPAKIDVKSIDISQFPLIYLYYSTYDKDGNYSGSISRDDVQIAEDRILEYVWGDGDYAHVKAHISLIIDSSGSMGEEMNNVLTAAKELVKKSDSADNIELIDFDSSIKKITDFTNDKDQLYNGLKKIKANGGTFLYDAIVKGITDLSHKDGLRMVIVLTDGKDENSRPGHGSKTSFEELKRKLNKFKIPVYTIGFGKDSDEATLKTISSVSNGKFYKAENVETLTAVYEKIINYVHSLHGFSYISHNGKCDGSKREIILKIAHLNYFKKFYYKAFVSKYWSYPFSNRRDDFCASEIAISPNGKYIINMSDLVILNNKGERVFISNRYWDTTDAFNVHFSNGFINYVHGYGYNGVLYKYDMNKKVLREFNNDAVVKMAGDFHKNYLYAPLSLSKNGQYVVFAARKDRNDNKLDAYRFILCDFLKGKVLWERTAYKGEFDEPGDIAVSDNGTVLINQDHNLFIFNKEGKLLKSLLWEKTNIRFEREDITGDGTRFLARFGDSVALFSIDGKIIWKKKIESNEKGGAVSVSQNGRYYAVAGKKGPFIFDEYGKLLFSLGLNKEFSTYLGGNGISVINDGTFIFSLGSRIYYAKLK